MHPLVVPPAKSSEASFESPKPNRLASQDLQKPCTPSQVSQGYVGAHLGLFGSGFKVLAQHLKNTSEFGSVLVVLDENSQDEAEFPPLAPQFGPVLKDLSEKCEDEAQLAAKSSS